MVEVPLKEIILKTIHKLEITVDQVVAHLTKEQTLPLEELVMNLLLVQLKELQAEMVLTFHLVVVEVVVAPVVKELMLLLQVVQVQQTKVVTVALV